MINELYKLTEQLLHFNRLFLKNYQEAREEGERKDFYEVIKPFTEKVNAVKLEWSKLMKEWLNQSPQKHIHLQQIEIVSRHIEEQSIQAFFPETSRARLLNANRTVEYFLTEVLKAVGK